MGLCSVNPFWLYFPSVARGGHRRRTKLRATMAKCSLACGAEFVRCVAAGSYSRCPTTTFPCAFDPCRRQLELGAGAPRNFTQLFDAGCVRGCDDTDDMQEIEVDWIDSSCRKSPWVCDDPWGLNTPPPPPPTPPPRLPLSPSPSLPPSPPPSELSRGALVGIAVAAVLALALVLGVVLKVRSARRGVRRPAAGVSMGRVKGKLQSLPGSNP